MNAEMTKKAVPFTFERAFDREGKDSAAPAPAKRRMMSAEEIDAVRAEAFALGKREGEASAARRHAEALQLFTTRLDAFAITMEEAVRPARSEAVTLAYVIALKLARHLLKEKPRGEIEALIAQCIEEQKSEPHIVLRVNDMLFDDVKAAAQKLAATRGFQGRIHVVGEPQIAAGDCVIEWADGGLERRIAAALGEIESIVSGYFQADGDAVSLPSPAEVLGTGSAETGEISAPRSEGVE